MNLFALLGDGETLFIQYVLLLVTGRTKDFIFGLMGLIFTLHFISWLKLQIRHSRPAFDDPSLGMQNASQFCSGEFGNPSGHALHSSQVAMTYLFYYKNEASGWFKANPVKGFLAHVLVFVYILGVCVCRIYLGRHSFDQVLLGLAVGFSCAIFLIKCYKPFMFDPVFYPEAGENMNVTVTRAKKAFQISAFCYLVVLFKMIGLYLYVDST